MNFSIKTLKLIDSASTGKKISGRLTSQIPEEDREYFKTQFEVENFLAGIYCFANKSHPKKCLCCGNKTQFKDFITGFKTYCSVSCATKINNQIYNKQKNEQKSKKHLQENLHKLILCSAEYTKENNIKTISELSIEYNVSYGSLRKYLSKNKLIKFNDINHKRKNEKLLKKFPELLDKEFFTNQQNQKKSSKVVSKEMGISPNTLCVYARKSGSAFPSTSSAGEYEVKQFFKAITNIEENSRKIIAPYELDIFIPKYNIAVEYNGAFWHSEQNGKNKNYHIEKQILAEKSGIKLIQLFDFEWNNRQDQIKGYFHYLLDINIKTIFARKTTVQQISKTQSAEFLDKNHIQGNVNSSINFGLFHGDELVSVITLGKCRFTKKYDYEILRFCNKMDVKIIGGLSKLISHIKNNLEFNTIVSYTHRRLFDGNSFLKSGFKLSHKTEPGYFWANQHSHEILSRYKTQKHKLNTTLTESEFMVSKGYVKVWDCGQLVFVLEK